MDEDGVGNTTLNQVTHSDKLGCFGFQGERVCYPPFCWACETPCSSIRYMGITASHKEPKGAVQTLVTDWSVSSISVCRPGLWWCVSLLRALPPRIWMKFWLDMPVQCSQCQRQLFFSLLLDVCCAFQVVYSITTPLLSSPVVTSASPTLALMTPWPKKPFCLDKLRH